MIAGVSGRLISATFAQHALSEIPSLVPPIPTSAARALETVADRIDAQLGPASAVRAITDVALLPLLHVLGFDIEERVDRADACWLRTRAGNSHGPIAIVVPWEQPLGPVWRQSVTAAVGVDASWCVCSNGRSLRILDARRTWSRAFLEIDLRTLATSPDTGHLLWALARAEAMVATPTVLDVAAAQSAAHGIAVCRALGHGVLEALQALFEALSHGSRAKRASTVALEHALTVLYRVLFLLFAEARGLVPTWHPVYRDRYSIATIVSLLMDGRQCRGLWETIQAVSRMAHAGCSAGELKVTAFNGRLFAPTEAASFERRRVADTVMRRAILAVGTTRTPSRSQRARIAYRELDVEQLGAVYERVLDFEPSAGGGSTLVETRDVRKSTGAFYTPRAMTAFLVRQTLSPLVENRPAADILRLRIVDPAMGSGAFLVAALRYLAAAAEDALIREGRWHPADVTTADRAALRRDIASRCLYGVDLNPTAVQVARLSLWLATLAADKPLSFLDHHLVVGNSIVGASVDDLRRQPTRDARTVQRAHSLPLFAEEVNATLLQAADVRVRLATSPDDSPAIVRDKERALAALQATGAPLTRLGRALDLWCAGWFWDDDAAPDRAVFGSLVDRLLDRASSIPERAAERLLRVSDDIAKRSRFLHWPIAFPEVFNGGSPGFDAVIGNPPWDMVRGDSGEDEVRGDRRKEARHMVDFVKTSGVYRIDGRAHVNRYQLFVERALHITRRGGRIGFVLPSGVVIDAGAASLRQQLFARADVDTVTGLDNRAGVFPIHRSMRFVLLTCTSGQPTERIACRFGIRHPEELESDPAPSRAPLVLTRKLIARISGEDDLGIPEMATAADLRIVESITARIPQLGAREGWHVQFGRELNASDDRRAFVPPHPTSTGRPVVEGKQIDPFRVAAQSPWEVAADSIQARRIPRRSRLAYRDVASATNRLTLIAAIVPADAVTTHTLFCLRTPLPLGAQHVLCALMNSFVANYLIRLRVNTHVTVSLVSRLPVPVVHETDPAFRQLATIAASLARAETSAEGSPAYVEMQAVVARLYGLTEPDFAHVLETFPLIRTEVRNASMRRFIAAQ